MGILMMTLLIIEINSKNVTEYIEGYEEGYEEGYNYGKASYDEEQEEEDW